MKLALVARASDRGLGIQTLGYYQHLKPHKTLVVDMRRYEPHAQHLARFPDAIVSYFHDGLPEADMRELVKGCDVLLTAETPYDYRLYSIAREAGCASVIHANPEFWRYEVDLDLEKPDVVLAATPWRLEHLEGASVLPMPIDIEAAPFRKIERVETFLHIAGNSTYYDRNGTQIVMAALSYVRSEIQVVVRAQFAPRKAELRRVPQNVHLEWITDDLPSHWDLYERGDVLLMPRRFGGLTLPVQEAAACGIPALMAERFPEEKWPGVIGVPIDVTNLVKMQGGEIPVQSANIKAFAAAIDKLAASPDLVASRARLARKWAEERSWNRLLPEWQRTLSEARRLRV